MRILVVDDHEVVRVGLRQILSNNGAEVVDQAASVADALERIGAAPYSAVLLELSLPDGSGLDALREIRRIRPRLPVLVLSTHPEEIWAFHAIRAGANGYLNKSATAVEISTAVRQVVAGGRYPSARMQRPTIVPDGAPSDDRNRLQSLSHREFEVLRLLGSGMQVGEAARVLGLSVKTVCTHSEHVLRKLGFSNNMEIIRFCLIQGLPGDRKSAGGPSSGSTAA